MNSAGTPLSDGTIGDPHYALTSVPSLSPTSTIVLRSDGPVGAAVVGPWAGDDNLSAWISPDSPNLGSSAVGEYFYTTTFDLTGFDPATAVIYGAWAADDIGAAIYLNGNLITVLTDLSYGPQNYTGLNTFNYYYRNDQGGVSETVNAPIQSGFVQGINTLSFRVDNLGGAT
ncbi:MAG: hypothetical protein JOZ05_01375, partial [Acetobacteraceae bacterium]|nr:hypothetical protein [Acetobacteraceae bacterium]